MDPKIKEKEFKGKGKPRKEAKREKDPKFPKDKKPYIGRNKIEWRTSDPVMTKLVANLPFGQPLGISQPINAIGDSAQSAVLVANEMPGVLGIRTRLTIGNVGSSGGIYNSAANLCFRKIYSFVRHANSGSKNYEAADLGMYLLAIGQALGLLGWLQRLYRIVNEYSATNRLLPVALINTMGVDATDVVANQPNLKYLIAWFGRAIGAIAFPDIPYMHACYEAYKWVIKDSDSPKEQLYILDSAGFGKYNPVLTTTGGGVEFNTTTPWGDPLVAANRMTFAQIYSYVHEIMDVLLSDEDCGIISGDILKAYKDGGLFTPEAFGEYDVFVKDEEILQQIHNAHVIDESDVQLLRFEQAVGGTGQAPYITPYMGVAGNVYTNAISVGAHLFIDAFSKEPDPNEVVNCTVLNPQFKIQQNTPATTFSVDPGSVTYDLHLPVSACMCTGLNTVGAPNIVDMTTQLVRYQKTAFCGTSHVMSGREADLTHFDWHPFKMYVILNGSGVPTSLQVLGDYQNCRFFTYDVGVRIHENSMLSLFNYVESNFYQNSR